MCVCTNVWTLKAQQRTLLRLEPKHSLRGCHIETPLLRHGALLTRLHVTPFAALLAPLKNI